MDVLSLRDRRVSRLFSNTSCCCHARGRRCVCVYVWTKLSLIKSQFDDWVLDMSLENRVLRVMLAVAVPVAAVFFLWSFVTELAGMIAASMVWLLWQLLVWIAETILLAILGYGALSAWRDRRRIAVGVQQIKIFFSDELSGNTVTQEIASHGYVRSMCK